MTMDRPVRVYTLDQEFMSAHISSQPAVDLVTCIIFADSLEAISLTTNLRTIVTFHGKARQTYSAIVTLGILHLLGPTITLQT